LTPEILDLMKRFKTLRVQVNDEADRCFTNVFSNAGCFPARGD
jgi:hypothetical protein